jgi:hypothetical protein
MEGGVGEFMNGANGKKEQKDGPDALKRKVKKKGRRESGESP